MDFWGYKKDLNSIGGLSQKFQVFEITNFFEKIVLFCFPCLKFPDFLINWNVNFIRKSGNLRQENKTNPLFRKSWWFQKLGTFDWDLRLTSNLFCSPRNPLKFMGKLSRNDKTRKRFRNRKNPRSCYSFIGHPVRTYPQSETCPFTSEDQLVHVYRVGT